MKNIVEDIKMYIESPVMDWNQIRVKKKKTASYDYLNQIGG